MHQGPSSPRRPVRRLRARAAAVLAAALLAAAATPSGAEPLRLTITSYNVIAIPCLAKDEPVVAFARTMMGIDACAPNPGWYGKAMGKRMGALGRWLANQAGRAHGSDVVVLQEAYTSEADVFDDRALQRVIAAGSYPHVATGAASTLGNDIVSLAELARNNSYKNPPRGAFSSGLVVFSRYPILEQRMVGFGDVCTLDDCGANKGVLYVRIGLPNGETADLFATHLQAADKAERVRRRQVDIATRFAGGLAPSSYRFYVGDFNFRDSEKTGSFRAFRSATGALHAGQICLEDPACKVLPDEREARLKAAGAVVDHQFFLPPPDGRAIRPTLVRFGDAKTGGRAISDHQYLQVRYQLGE